MVGVSLYGIYDLGDSSSNIPLSGTQVIGILANMAFNGISAFYIGRAYYYFWATGGIHGLGDTQNVPGKELLVKAGEVAGKGVALAEAKLDKMDLEDKKADNEAQKVAELTQQ